MRRRRSSARFSNRGTSGFTLIELMVAFSIASVVVIAVGSGFVFVTKAWTDQLGRVQTQQALRTTVESVTREMRLAGACMPSPTLPPIATTYDPYQPLAGNHGTTDSITITSNLLVQRVHQYHRPGHDQLHGRSVGVHLQQRYDDEPAWAVRGVVPDSERQCGDGYDNGESDEAAAS